jgi:hypothetical protein
MDEEQASESATQLSVLSARSLALPLIPAGDYTSRVTRQAAVSAALFDVAVLASAGLSVALVPAHAVFLLRELGRLESLLPALPRARRNAPQELLIAQTRAALPHVPLRRNRQQLLRIR